MGLIGRKQFKICVYGIHGQNDSLKSWPVVEIWQAVILAMADVQTYKLHCGFFTWLFQKM